MLDCAGQRVGLNEIEMKTETETEKLMKELETQQRDPYLVESIEYTNTL